MDFLLPATTYNPCAASQKRQTYNINIDEEIQDTPGLISQFPSIPGRPAMMSPTFQDDLPTPKASVLNANRPRIVSPLAQEFDDLYDVSESEEEEVPLKISASVKRVVNSRTSSARSSRRFPSIVIPSPSAWPTIQKLQQKAKSPISPARITPLSPAPAMMSLLTARMLQVPAGSATPSLDGSMTSEELDKLSCPSTPDLHARRENDGEWDAPVQLGPEAMATLSHLSSLDNIEEEQIIEIPVAEMQQTGQLTATGSHFLTPRDEEEDPLSALSIPSPGGFFSSLGSSARNTWSTQPEEDIVPSTAAAENFYGVPWAQPEDKIVPRIIEIAPSVGIASGPPTARLASEVDEVTEMQRSGSVRSEYKSNYLEELQSMAAANLDRTGDWLSAQQTYLAACVAAPLPSPVKTESSGTRSRSGSLEDTICSPSKKSVRFLEEVIESHVAVSEPEVAKESVYNEASEFLSQVTNPMDAFIHRQTRSDAIHTIRRHMPATHRNQLLGTYEIETVDRPAPARPVSSFYTDDPTVLKERIARAEKERQALEQIKPAAWVLEAQKFLNGGKLLTAPASRFLKRSTQARVLDLGGQSGCDWAWQMCRDYEHATITTAIASSQDNCAELEAPINHKTTVVPNLWTLPFPAGHFDIISARSLYALLKTDKPTGSQIDQIDLCLKECMRCLKPGGYLEFNVLDADLVHAGPLAQAMSVEFGFNLKTRGYDAALTKSFIPRLGRAGFDNVKRAWTFLPMGKTAAKWTDELNVGATSQLEKGISAEGEVEQIAAHGSTNDVAAVTGLVGSWAWERWMIKLQTEMEKPEDKLLVGVPAVIEECAKNGAGWRTLNGWARKPF